MKVLIVGGGGREHAIAWKLAQSSRLTKLYCAPGNPGIAKCAECIAISADDVKGLTDFAIEKKIDLVVIGPEAPLVLGLADDLNNKGIKVFGPKAASARLEGSKVFCKQILKKYNVPTAEFLVCGSAESALSAANKFYSAGKKVVIKADGLAAGKGVIVTSSLEEAESAIKLAMIDKAFGSAGDSVVVEERLYGEEASLLAFVDRMEYRIMIPAQDHKRVGEGDIGLNTGGMGAYAPAPVADKNVLEKVKKKVFQPVLEGLIKEGCPYSGVLYAGLIICDGEPFVIEFNCRFGDPETQVVLPLLKSDLLEVADAVASGKLAEIQPEWSDDFALCVVIASGGYPDKYEKDKVIKGLDESNNVKNAVVFHAGTRFSNGNVVTSGGRVLGVTGIGKDVSEAKNIAYNAVSKIHFDKMYFRRDIAYKALERMK